MADDADKKPVDGSDEVEEVETKFVDTPTKKDVHDEEEFDLDKFPVREWVFEFPFSGGLEHVSFNPVVSGIGVIFLWGLSIWCMADQETAATVLSQWKSQITLDFTWLFILARSVYLFFLLFIVYRFGHVKLGPQDEPPEFTTGSYFTMIFAAGVAVGLFVYGFSEPVIHRHHTFFTNQEYRSQDEKDLFALNQTIINWGFSAWSPYLIVAVSMGLAGHRYKLPMTFRSCLYPIFREYTWGWIGDVIDGVTIVTTVAGVCTSLGLGAINVVAGFQFLGWVDADATQDRLTLIQNLTIWGITCIATGSVMAGLHAGIQTLSYVAFCLGMALNFMVFLMDNTSFLVNLTIQELGYYLQRGFLEYNFWTDAFGQLKTGEGRATDGMAAADWWMDGWGIFYQAWWISWAAFVGLFVARISKGRTIAEVITYCLFVPAIYCIYWFSVFGGTAIRQSRQAEELEVLGATYFNDSTTFLVPGSMVCYDVPQEPIFIDEQESPIFENTLPGVTPVCQYATATDVAFNVLYSYSFQDTFSGNGLGPFLSVIFIIALAIYFATSSDSGSLIVDHLSANGRLHHHWIQRLFWAVTEGAVATAVLSAGGADSLAALQTVSVIAGLPFVVIVTYLMESIWVMCKFADDHPDSLDLTECDEANKQSEFVFPIYGGIFNAFEYALSLGNVNHHRVARNMDKPTTAQVTEFVKGLFLPFVSLYQIMSVTHPRQGKSNLLISAAYATCFLGWICLFTSTAVLEGNGLKSFGWCSFFCAAAILGNVRNGFRSRYNLRSNIFGDFMASLFVWPQVVAQMRIQCMELGLPHGSDRPDAHGGEENELEA